MRHRLLTWMVSAACLAVSGAAAADTTDDLLLRLRDKGILTQQEYETLSKRKAAEDGAQVATAPPSPPQAPTTASTSTSQDSNLIRATDSGVGVKIGSVSVKLSGSINGFFVHDSGASAAPDHVVQGGLATVGQGDTSSIRNGLLPGFLRVDVVTNQAGWDVGAHFGLYPGIDSVTGAGGANSGGSPTALSTSGIDARQTYLTVGRAEFGELKIGRDIGLFGSDAILNDMTLLGVGTAAGNSAPSNTSLGRIGLGYIYADFMPQITYTSPKWEGVQASAGVFQPLVTAGGTEVNPTPGVQLKLTFDHAYSGLATHIWLGYLNQTHKSVAGLPDYDGVGYEGGGKVNYGPFGAVGYYYTGSGLGTTGLFILSTDSLGAKRDSHGYYLQGTYNPIPKLTLGVSYGESDLSLASGEVDPTLLKSNASYVGQARYALTPWFSLVGEYTHTESTAHNADEAVSDALAAGGILFF